MSKLNYSDYASNYYSKGLKFNLTVSDIIDINKSKDTMSVDQLASKYNIQPATVEYILDRNYKSGGCKVNSKFIKDEKYCSIVKVNKVEKEIATCLDDSYAYMIVDLLNDNETDEDCYYYVKESKEE